MKEYQRIDALIQEGYELVLENDCVGGCEKWLAAWEMIKELFAGGAAADIFDLDKKYRWAQLPSNYVQDAEMELHNAGLDDNAYHQKRIVFCGELIRWGGKDELFATNARVGMAEAYFELGEEAAAERLYKEWLREDPDWGWGYIGWSDHYRLEGGQPEKAEEILLNGYAREGLRDKGDVAGRLMELYEDMGWSDKSKDFKKALSMARAEPGGDGSRNPAPARAVKIGRNEPCPCGSGKKHKKCCGA